MYEFEQEMREWARRAGSNAFDDDVDGEIDDDVVADDIDDASDEARVEVDVEVEAPVDTFEPDRRGVDDFDAAAGAPDGLEPDELDPDEVERDELEPDAADEDGEAEPALVAGRPRVRRSGIVLAALLGIAGIALCGFGVNAYRDASEADDEAAAIADERHALERQEAELNETTLAIQTAANDVNTAVRGVIDSSNEFTAAGRAVTDIANAAVAVLNQGNPAGARSAFAANVGPAVSEHEAKYPPVANAPATLQAALDALRAQLDE